jgi:hypothetical protein
MSVHLKKREVEKVMAPGGERASRREPPAAVPRNAREATLAEFSWTILQGRWTVLGSLAAALAIALLYLWIATPKYRSSVLIQFEERTKTVAGLEYFSAMFREGAASVEIEIVRSRTLLNTVIEQLSLDVEAAPRTLPLIGKAIARRYAGAGPAPAVLGLRRFAWGGEKIRLSSLSVSRELLGERLTLTALGDGRYEVKLPTGATIVSGALGWARQRAGGGGIAAVHVNRSVRDTEVFRLGCGVEKDALLAKFLDRSAHIGIIGQGYVGLPRALLFHEAGFQVTGFDVERRKLEGLPRGEEWKVPRHHRIRRPAPRATGDSRVDHLSRHDRRGASADPGSGQMGRGRDFCYVENVVHANLLAATTASPEAFTASRSATGPHSSSSSSAFAPR